VSAPQGVGPRPETGQTPWSVVGCNKPTRSSADETVEVVQNGKDGTAEKVGNLLARSSDQVSRTQTAHIDGGAVFEGTSREAPELGHYRCPRFGPHRAQSISEGDATDSVTAKAACCGSSAMCRMADGDVGRERPNDPHLCIFLTRSRAGHRPNANSKRDDIGT